MNKRELQYQRTLDAIRKSVDEIVTEEGYDKLTIRGLCQKAGIDHSTFYHYFSSKDDLILDRRNRFASYFLDIYEKKLRTLPTKEALKAYTGEYIAYVQSRVLQVEIQFEKTMLSLSSKGKIEDSEAQKVLRKIIKQGRERGEFTTEASEEEIYNLFQVYFLGLRIRFCHTNGASLPDEYLTGEIIRWIDSLY